MISGQVLANFFEKAIAELPSRADAEGNIHPTDMAEALPTVVSAAGGGELAFETAIKFLADAMAATGVRDAGRYLTNTRDKLSLYEAHAYLSHARHIVMAL